MTRPEALAKLQEDPDSFTVAELYALHRSLDVEVDVTRQVMGLIDAEITRREASGYVPGPAHLMQTLGQRNKTDG